MSPVQSPVQPPEINRRVTEQASFGRQPEPVAKARNNNKWLTLPGVAILGVLFYWMFTYSGPYRFLAELQLKWFGFYSPKLTFLLIAGALFVGLMASVKAIKLIFRGAERPVPEMQTPSVANPAIASTTTAPANDAAVRWMQSLRLFMIYATPLIIVGIGAFAYYNGTQEGNLQHLSSVDFETGKLEAHALYADIQGHLSESYISDDNYAYIPMLSEANAAGPVKLLVGVSDRDMQKYLHREANGTVIVRGVADKGLASDLRYAFEKNGITVADPVWVVHAGRDPSSDRKSGLLIMVFGVVLGVFLIGWQSYQKRKSKAQASRAIA
jgi:hypothetical protein